MELFQEARGASGALRIDIKIIAIPSTLLLLTQDTPIMIPIIPDTTHFQIQLEQINSTKRICEDEVIAKPL